VEIAALIILNISLCFVKEYANKMQICCDSTPNLCTWGMSKAFHKLNHFAFYCKLEDRITHLQFSDILANWYEKCFFSVNCNNMLATFIYSLIKPEAKTN